VTAVGAAGQRWAVAFGSGELLASSGPADPLRQIASIDDQRAIALAGLSGARWAAAYTDSITGRVVVADPAEGHHVTAVDQRPTGLVSDGRWLYLGDASGKIRTFDGNDLERRERIVEAHDRGVASMAINSDGSLIVSAGNDGSIAVWNVASDGALAERARLVGTRAAITSLTVSPDSRWLASTSQDGTVRMVDLEHGDPAGDEIPVGLNTTVAFAPDADRQLYVASSGLHLWDMRIESWQRMACEIIGSRRLVEAEKELYLRGEPAIDPCPA
jgi:hypothetical protein